MTTWALIPDHHRQRQRPCRAQEMFCLSPRFQRVWNMAIEAGQSPLIVSGRFGAVKSSQVVYPYDDTLRRMRRSERAIWAADTAERLAMILASGDRLVSYLPPAIEKALSQELYTWGIELEPPMIAARAG